jgi:hypothetical protein
MYWEASLFYWNVLYLIIVGTCSFHFISFIKILAHNPTVIQSLDRVAHSDHCLNVVEVFLNFLGTL